MAGHRLEERALLRRRALHPGTRELRRRGDHEPHALVAREERGAPAERLLRRALGARGAHRFRGTRAEARQLGVRRRDIAGGLEQRHARLLRLRDTRVAREARGEGRVGLGGGGRVPRLDVGDGGVVLRVGRPRVTRVRRRESLIGLPGFSSLVERVEHHGDPDHRVGATFPPRVVANELLVRGHGLLASPEVGQELPAQVLILDVVPVRRVLRHEPRRELDGALFRLTRGVLISARPRGAVGQHVRFDGVANGVGRPRRARVAVGEGDVHFLRRAPILAALDQRVGERVGGRRADHPDRVRERATAGARRHRLREIPLDLRLGELPLLVERITDQALRLGSVAIVRILLDVRTERRGHDVPPLRLGRAATLLHERALGDLGFGERRHVLVHDREQRILGGAIGLVARDGRVERDDGVLPGGLRQLGVGIGIPEGGARELGAGLQIVPLTEERLAVIEAHRLRTVGRCELAQVPPVQIGRLGVARPVSPLRAR